MTAKGDEPGAGAGRATEAATGAATGAPSGAAPGFDARLERLERIVGDLEDGGLELEPALERYREGVALLKGCREELAGYRRQVEELSREAEASLKPFEGDPDVEPEERPGGGHRPRG